MSLSTNSVRPVIVTIAGGSASGKTTFAKALTQTLADGPPALRVEVVGIDRYFYRGASGGPVFVSPSSGETLPNNNMPDSADNARLVADLNARRSSVEAPEVIIVEGLMALHVPEIRDCADVRLFIDLEDDVRALRRLLRDSAGGRGNTDPAWIATYYRECAAPGHAAYVWPSRVHADLIIRGDSDFARTAPLAAAAIRAALTSLP